MQLSTWTVSTSNEICRLSFSIMIFYGHFMIFKQCVHKDFLTTVFSTVRITQMRQTEMNLPVLSVSPSKSPSSGRGLEIKQEKLYRRPRHTKIQTTHFLCHYRASSSIHNNDMTHHTFIQWSTIIIGLNWLLSYLM